ncbi:transposase [Caballeronia choica]|uniref:Transposase n=1 Tax=Caballeronia choica TaxID=326476 RepID=A0A158KQQ0_9BURK|nr:transposase [Caballeronia choica]
MNRIVRVGVDLAKNVMQLHGVDVAERVVIRKAVTREKFLEWFANLAPCVVAMEACTASHFWARRLREYGHDVRLIPPQFAAPYRKGGSSVKNDAVDAEAICEAASRPHMRYVPVKTPAQQGALVLHRMRQGLIEEVLHWSTGFAAWLLNSGYFFRRAFTGSERGSPNQWRTGGTNCPDSRGWHCCEGGRELSSLTQRSTGSTNRSPSMQRMIPTRDASRKCSVSG